MDDHNLIFELKVLADVEIAMVDESDTRGSYAAHYNAKTLREAAQRLQYYHDKDKLKEALDARDKRIS